MMGCSRAPESLRTGGILSVSRREMLFLEHSLQEGRQQRRDVRYRLHVMRSYGSEHIMRPVSMARII